MGKKVKDRKKGKKIAGTSIKIEKLTKFQKTIEDKIMQKNCEKKIKITEEW